MTDTSTLVQSWFAVDELEPGIFCIAEPLHVENVKSHLVVGTERAVLIDTGMGIGDLRTLVGDLTDLPIQVVNSHAHWDHIGANWRFAEIAIHRAEAVRLTLGLGNDRWAPAFAPQYLTGPLPASVDLKTLSIPPSRATTFLDGGETFDLGGRTLEVIHAPGHSPGGIVLLDRKNGVLFSTDVAYAGALYCQYADANLDDYRSSMRTLAEFAPTLRVVYPSHNQRSIQPGVLPKMCDALDAVAAGRVAEEIADGIAKHEFDGFSVLVAADRERAA